MPASRPESRWVGQSDELAGPLLAALAVEYSSRYGDVLDTVREQLRTYPAEKFSPPSGGLLVLVQDGHAIAGGAFQRHDERTAEFKRIWTHSAHRRAGLGRRVLTELETEAGKRGYTRIYLTTGPRQPEAKHLYLDAGYTPLFDPEADPPNVVPLPFEKLLAIRTGAR